MKIQRTKNAVKGVFFGYLNKIVAIIFPFIIRTIIINILGVQYLGLNSLFSSILTILSLADLGFSTAVVYSMYKPIAEDDTETVNALLNFYKKVYRIVGLIIFSVGLVVMPFLPYLINGSYPADINLYLLYSIFLANNVIGYFFFAYKRSLFAAHQRNDILSKSQILVSLLMYCSQIAVLFLTQNYYIYIIFLPLSTLATNLYINYLTKKTYPQYFCKGELDKPVKDKIKKQITALFTHRIGYVIQSSIDNICISAFMGLTLLGKFNNYYYLITAVEAFLTIIKQSLVAGVGNSIIVESHEYNKNSFYKTFFSFMWLVGWCTTCFMCLYQPFMQVWVGTQYMFPLSIVICLTILFFSKEIRGIVGLYKDALGMWWEDRFKPIVISVVNLIGTLISAYFGFFEGILISTIVSYILVGLPWETFVFFKHYMKEKKLKYYLKQLYYTFATLIAVTLTYFLCSLIAVTGIKKVIINFVICLIIPNLIFALFYFKTPEFKQLFSSKNKIIIKLKNLYKKVLKKLKYILSFIFYLIPINKNKITFANFFGKGYGCNPKYIAEEFIKDKKYKLIWFVNDLNTDLPKEIKKVKYGSLKHYYHLITARLWVDNVRSGLKPPFKRKKQFYLQTWHGRSYLKCVEKDVEEFLDSGYVLKAKQDGKLSDFIISGSEHQTKVIKRAFWFNGEILKTGLPRDDALFKDNRKDIEDLKQKFNLKDKKIILYAPSFRTTNSFYENLNLDANEFIKVFNKKFGGEHVFCLRLHPNDASRKDLKIKNCIDLTSVPDSQLVLSCSDYIISDYSGMLFDGLMLNKFSFGFAPDYYDYIKKERHLYIDFKDLPFPYELNTTDLLEKIKNLDIKKYKKEVELYNKNYGFYDNKNSSKKVKEFLQKNNIV